MPALRPARSRQADPDVLAAYLAGAARRVRAEPPSWTHGVRRPLLSPEGARLGLALPGRGLLLDSDLRRFGVTRPIPDVLTRDEVLAVADPLRRVLEEEAAMRLAVESVARGRARRAQALSPRAVLFALSTLNDYLTAAANGKKDNSRFSKATITTVASTWSCLFRATGLPAAGAFTGALGASAPNRTTLGALNYNWTAPGADTGYLHAIALNGTASLNAVHVVDLLYECGGISTTSTAVQNLGAAALTRYTSGIGVMMICVITTALGATASNITITYTNSAGTGSRSTGALALLTSGIVERLTPVAAAPLIVLQSGDVGVQSVQSVQLSASMTGSGVLALIQYFPVADVMGLPLNSQVSYNMISGAIEGVKALDKTSGNEGGCLTALVLANGTSTGQLGGKLIQSRG